GAPEIANGTGTRGVGGVLAAITLAAALAALAAILTLVTGIDRVRTPRGVARSAAIAGAVALVLMGTLLGPRLASSAWHQFRHPIPAENVSDPASRLTHLGGARYFYWRAAADASE